jgi:hypothetical protein
VLTGTSCAVTGDALAGAGIYGFEDANDNSGGTLIFNKGEAGVAITSETNVSLYRCSLNSSSEAICERTYGYFVHGTDYYTINKSNSNVKTATGKSSIVNQCSSGDDIGTLFKDESVIKLCLDGTEKTQDIESTASVQTYFMINKADNVFTTGASDNDKYIAIEASKNAITLVSKDYDYCIKANEVVSETFKEICGSGTDANPCGSNPLSECEGGLCTREVDDGSCKMKADGTTNTHCGTTGYYILNTTDGADTNGFYSLVEKSNGGGKVGTLYSCTGDNTCIPVPSANFPVGYYKNAASTGETDAPYIKCTANNACTILTEVASDCTKAGDITFASVYKICLDAGESITPVAINTTNNSKKHFVSLANSSIFGNQNEDKYVMIDMANGNIHYTAPGKVDAAQTYYYTNLSYEVHLKDSNTAICTAPTTIVEFKLDKSGSTDDSLIVYKKHAEYTTSA